MIDIKLIRENPELVKENIKKKFQNEKLPLVDKVKKLDEDWRKLKYKEDGLRSERNKISEEINKIKKEKRNVNSFIKKAKEIPEKIAKIEEKRKGLEVKIREMMFRIPNIIYKGVPVGRDESENVELIQVGDKRKFDFPIKNHVELIENLGVGDFESSARVSGKGFYYLKGDLALLNQALIRFGIDFMKSKGYEYIEGPLMLNSEALYASLDKEAIDESVYNIKGKDLGLVGTSEQSLLAMHAGEVLKESELPKKYFSYSMCFRQEIGAHGINEKGLWRTHQFNKVEQFIFCMPEDSEKYYDELLKNSEELMKKLELPYRVLEMCTGDLADWKYRSADIEVWRPTINGYGEVGSSTNCTDYQARKLGINYLKKDGERGFLHTLNDTALATSRIMVAILENNQQKDGTVKIPKVLWKYTGFKKLKPNKD